MPIENPLYSYELNAEERHRSYMSAIDNIEMAIAGIKGIKSAMGMTVESNMEHDLKAALTKISRLMQEDKTQ